ncbi:hypothetical protein [Streptomyces beigongshangae]|uniref:hypothetical protein n=1 Tax=Streptomyces beigongshangae TaxID=2841597 RepID=UPI001C859FA1|nr:hypothetical protein [Streptomyces sp. REN17]
MATTRRITRGITQGITTSAALAAVCTASLAGCGIGGRGGPEAGARTEGARAKGAHGARKGAGAAPGSRVRLIGDGSTAFTGAQPRLRRAERLKPGRRPPQFVVFSWDGAGEDGQRLFSHFRKVARKNRATMTYFLSGVYMLPEDKRDLYRPPRHSPGRSDIGFNDVRGVKRTVKQLRGAWLEGNEIGTHFNGHFCGEGGVGEWSVGEWKDEIAQAKSFVKSWKSNTGRTKGAPLPFDYDRELVGARTPCLEGRKNFRRAARELGFRYDTSGVNDQVWPKKKKGLWDLSMQLVPVPDRGFETLTMDYNFMINQSGSTSQGDPDQYEYWGDQMRDGLLKGFSRAYKGNRAPLIIGNHFESWNGGTYMRAVEETIERVCTKREVRCVSFRQLADWLDAQDPKTLAKLRKLKVGKSPKRGWASYLSGRPAPAPRGVPGAPAVRP